MHNLSSADFFSKSNFLNNFFQEYHQKVKQFEDVLIRVQTICKGYQKTGTLAGEKSINTTMPIRGYRIHTGMAQ